MKHLSTVVYLVLIWVFLGVGCTVAPDRDSSGARQELLEVFLVRHGEKVDHSRDPELAPAGYVRAALLAQILRDAEIEYVHSSDFIRTRKTAEPMAVSCGIEVEFYDPSDLKDLADELKKAGGRHLVVGHSNTTPRLVELLGCESGSEIDEEEYDRLYIVTIRSNGEVSCLLLRYGVPYLPGL